MRRLSMRQVETHVSMLNHYLELPPEQEFVLDAAYDAYALQQKSPGGGVKTVFDRDTLRNVDNFVVGMLYGAEEERKAAGGVRVTWNK